MNNFQKHNSLIFMQSPPYLKKSSWICEITRCVKTFIGFVGNFKVSKLKLVWSAKKSKKALLLNTFILHTIYIWNLNLLQLRKRSNVLRLRPSARPPDAAAWDTSKAISTRLTVASTTAPIRPETSGPQSRPSRTDFKPCQPEQCPLH